VAANETHSLTLVVSIDGVVPRHISAETMPQLLSIARAGASCYDAVTITSSLTLPAHASMLRGVDADSHGLRDNTPRALRTKAPTFLAQARREGLKTASFTNWRPFECLFEEGVVEEKFYIDSGYEPSDDLRISTAAQELLEKRQHQLVFVYLAQADLAGHKGGWDSEEYI